MRAGRSRPGRWSPAITGRGVPISARLTNFHRRMDMAVADVNVLVVGDSTGDGLARWVRLLGNSFAGAYPAWTVVYRRWDDPNQNWTGANSLNVTVQAGTNGRTLTIWNASVSGQVVGYSMNNIAAIVTGYTPDMVMFNYGHNSPQLTDDYRAVHAQAVLTYMDNYPGACVVSMTQNPRDPVIWATTSPTYSDDQGRQQAICDLSAAWGVVTVDINAAFKKYGDYTTYLLNSDGLHPSDAGGSPYWRDLVWAAIRPNQGGVSGVINPGPQQGTTKVWVPAAQFYSISGSPSLAVSATVQAWALDDSTTEEVGAVVHIPMAWKRQNIALLWMSTGTVANTCTFTMAHQYLGGSRTAGTWVSDGSASFTASTTSGGMRYSYIYNRTGLGVTPLSLKIGRDGGNASDTLVGDALLIGMEIEQAY